MSEKLKWEAQKYPWGPTYTMDTSYIRCLTKCYVAIYEFPSEKLADIYNGNILKRHQIIHKIKSHCTEIKVHRQKCQGKIKFWVKALILFFVITRHILPSGNLLAGLGWSTKVQWQI